MHAKVAASAMMPHLQVLGSRTQQLWDAGALRAGERATISEALVLAAASGPPETQAQVRALAQWQLPRGGTPGGP